MGISTYEFTMHNLQDLLHEQHVSDCQDVWGHDEAIQEYLV